VTGCNPTPLRTPFVRNSLDTHAPYRYVSRKEQRSFNKPWLTKGILTSIANKNTLYSK